MFVFLLLIIIFAVVVVTAIGSAPLDKQPPRSPSASLQSVFASVNCTVVVGTEERKELGKIISENAKRGASCVVCVESNVEYELNGGVVSLVDTSVSLVGLQASQLTNVTINDRNFHIEGLKSNISFENIRLRLSKTVSPLQTSLLHTDFHSMISFQNVEAIGNSKCAFIGRSKVAYMHSSVFIGWKTVVGVSRRVEVEKCTFHSNTHHPVQQPSGVINVVCDNITTSAPCSLFVKSSHFEENEASLHCNGVQAVVTVLDSTFISNKGTPVFCNGCASLVLTSLEDEQMGNVFAHNTALKGTMAMCTKCGSVTINNSFVNASIAKGGGVFGGAVLSISHSTHVFLGPNLRIHNSGFSPQTNVFASGTVWMYEVEEVVVDGIECVNNIAGSGGAIYVQSCQTFTLSDATLENNNAWDGNGGALFMLNTKMATIGGHFKGNKAASAQGHALYVLQSNTVQLIDFAAENNGGPQFSRPVLGASVWIESATSTPSNLQFQNNTCVSDTPGVPNCTPVSGTFRKWNTSLTLDAMNTSFVNNLNGYSVSLRNVFATFSNTSVTNEVSSEGIYTDGSTTMTLQSTTIRTKHLGSSHFGLSQPKPLMYQALGALSIGHGVQIESFVAEDEDDEKETQQQWHDYHGSSENSNQEDVTIVSMPQGGVLTMSNQSRFTCPSGYEAKAHISIGEATFVQEWVLDCSLRRCKREIGVECNKTECAACPKIYPSMLYTSATMFCVACPANMYAIDATLMGREQGNTAKCKPCPVGADCANGLLHARTGYWADPTHFLGDEMGVGSEGIKTSGDEASVGVDNLEVRFYRCPDGYCCKEHTCETINKCSGNRDGRLCGKCKTGYSPSVASSACVADEQCTSASWFAPLLIIMCFAFAAMIAHQPHHWTWESLHLMVFFYQMVHNLVKVHHISDDEFANEVLEVVSSIPEFFEFTLPSFVGSFCVFPQSNVVFNIAIRFLMPVFIGTALLVLNLARHYRLFGTTPSTAHERGSQLSRLLLWSLNLTLTTVLKLVDCVEVEGSNVLYYAAEKECGSWQIPLYILTALLFIPIVVPILIRLCPLRSHFLKSSSLLKYPLMWSLLHNFVHDFGVHAWHWHAVMALHRSLISALSVFINDPLLQILLQLGVCLSMLAAHLSVKPFLNITNSNQGKKPNHHHHHQLQLHLHLQQLQKQLHLHNQRLQPLLQQLHLHMHLLPLQKHQTQDQLQPPQPQNQQLQQWLRQQLLQQHHHL
eukprot:m.174696 g.174696  ORF g.174696 m.174696 type:complete len:1234 (-) comp13509_c4_seq2:57-3758(-)